MVKKPSLPPGVDVRGNTIRIAFSWDKKRYREIFPFPATPQNIQRAGRLYGEIKQRIQLGVFTPEDFRAYFPNSETFAPDGPSTTWGNLAQQWLDTLDVSPNTREEYRKMLNKYWMPQLASRRIDTIRYRDLRELVSQIPWSSMKTRNNALIPLRGVFELAYSDELVENNPAARVKNLKHQSPPPDPFTAEEADLIIAALYESHGGGPEVVLAAYFEFAFYTGMRTSEILALQWQDIDFHNDYVRVDKARSKGRLNNQTKTSRVRDVLLNPRSLHALEVMRPLSYAAQGAVFVPYNAADLVPGEGYQTEKSQRIVFTEVLQRLKLRHRPAYNARHTYATMLLMRGANPAFVATQLGHSVSMTLTRYTKWIQGKADREELAKLGLG